MYIFPLLINTALIYLYVFSITKYNFLKFTFCLDFLCNYSYAELTHKPWPRNNKKREGPGATLKNDPYRKNVQSQRGRGQMDKRPCARGTTNFIVGGTQNTRCVDLKD